MLCLVNKVGITIFNLRIHQYYVQKHLLRWKKKIKLNKCTRTFVGSIAFFLLAQRLLVKIIKRKIKRERKKNCQFLLFKERCANFSQNTKKKKNYDVK